MPCHPPRFGAEACLRNGTKGVARLKEDHLGPGNRMNSMTCSAIPPPGLAGVDVPDLTFPATRAYVAKLFLVSKGRQATLTFVNANPQVGMAALLASVRPGGTLPEEGMAVGLSTLPCARWPGLKTWMQVSVPMGPLLLGRRINLA